MKGFRIFGDPGGIRTHGLSLRRRPLYPAELRDPNNICRLSYVGKTLEKYKLLSSICQMKEMLME